MIAPGPPAKNRPESDPPESHGSTPHPPVIVVTGPTASGKARLALAVARRLGVPLVSLDSMKVYRRMNTGTAKPAPLVIRETPVHMVDLREPWEPFSVGDYLRELSQLGPGLPRPWLLGGGTAFYLNALVAGIHPGPPPDDALRAGLEEQARRAGPEALHRRLAAVDPAAADSIHPADLKRIIRGIEVYELTGERLSQIQQRKSALLPPGSFRLVGVRRTRGELYDRIDRRVERMFEAGWVEEVETLVAAHDPPWGKEASQSIGYEQIREALAAGEDPRERVPVIQQRTRNFARSQLTWFRKLPVEWWGEDEHEALLASLEAGLQVCRRQGRWPEPDPARRNLPRESEKPLQ